MKKNDDGCQSQLVELTKKKEGYLLVHLYIDVVSILDLQKYERKKERFFTMVNEEKNDEEALFFLD